MILGSRRGERREREEDNEVEVNDITVHFKGEGRREEEGGVRRKGAGIGARKEKGKSEKRDPGPSTQDPAPPNIHPRSPQKPRDGRQIVRMFRGC